MKRPIRGQTPNVSRRTGSAWLHVRRLTPNLLVAAAITLVTLDARQGECDDWQQCRRLALDAAERQDHEAFHTLAWRAVQKGPAGDPQLMYLLARAQSLSGRPHDALVMIRRIVEKGVAIDAATNDDFRRVRALPDWPLVENLLASPAPSAPPARSAPAAPVSAGAETLRIAKTAFHAGAPPPPGFTVGGMAYDSASARFVIGDRQGRKLVVISDRSARPQDLVRAESAGFSNVNAVEIDRRRGDLWVVSANDAASDGASALHKLQLISGRPLETYPMADATFADVALMPDGTPLALDSAGRRVFRLRHGATRLETVLTLDHPSPVSLAPVNDHTIYVAHRDGLARVDLTTRRATPVKPNGELDLSGMTWIRAHDDGLIAMQRRQEGCRLVRLRVDGTRNRVRTLDVVEERAGNGCPPATISGDDLFYLREDGGEMVISRVPLR